LASEKRRSFFIGFFSNVEKWKKPDVPQKKLCCAAQRIPSGRKLHGHSFYQTDAAKRILIHTEYE